MKILATSYRELSTIGQWCLLWVITFRPLCLQPTLPTSTGCQLWSVMSVATLGPSSTAEPLVNGVHNISGKMFSSLI